jgi:hypothetical protein
MMQLGQPNSLPFKRACNPKSRFEQNGHFGLPGKTGVKRMAAPHAFCGLFID